MPKVFKCSACGGQHARPVGAKCQVVGVKNNDTTVDAGLDSPDDTNTKILNALSAVSSRLTAIEQRIEKTEEQLQNTKSGSDGVKLARLGTSTQEELDEDSDVGDDAVIPTIKFLKSSKQIQSAVDHRLQELSRINDQGMYKSQRGGKDQVMVKHQVPWPQNYVLAGTSKNRVTYDSLSTFQWMSGFCSIIREEPDVKVKNAMLDYVTDLMEDAQDFSWPSAKGAHALILCRMEEGKVNWSMSDKLDRLRRAHAQKIVTNPTTTRSSRGKMDTQGMVCKFFQTGKCIQKGDHTTNGQLYTHICAHCVTLGKRFPHALKDCRNKKENQSKNE